jgi:hypothetical protein
LAELRGEPISEAEYRRYCRMQEWGREHAPKAPLPTPPEKSTCFRGPILCRSERKSTMATQPIFDDVLPWPVQAPTNPRAVIGGNQPPLEERIPAEFRQAVIEERADFYQKLADLLGTPATETEEAKSGAIDRATCTDEETLAKCGVLAKTLRACEQLVDKVHADVKAPHLQAGRLVDAEKRSLVDQLKAARVKVEGLQTADD